MRSEFRITKISKDYSTRKLVKLGVYLLWGLFDFKNGSFWPWWPSGSITKVLTDIYVNSWTIAHKNRQNGGFTCIGACLTLKMGRFSRKGQLAPQLRS
ncbi:hypothetical protein H5410_023116 [Solanum commersonii]|uniref:Uncharacterized protein n=1 Tax=Solanum commersonii TaxID=4109 RepID=A0A9J5ZFX9_SOLCO|nr:hypothetical protein H5410_023116 [Solanum commersonii]